MQSLKNDFVFCRPLIQKLVFLKFSTKTYVMGTQKNHLNGSRSNLLLRLYMLARSHLTGSKVALSAFARAMLGTDSSIEASS